ncbi:Pyridoxal phosphate homeostasis protein [wastewater metagenome]|uniref:Pyridoxal phosphate homeostasis protein n=4 Tax=root TaxID=1 RepID=A0A5B8RKG4_9ZZZZ|nr:pyridoxal phosphate homeostasis protein [uncultured organism]
MHTIADRLDNLRERVRAAEIGCGREPGSVSILAVSKTQPVEAIREAAAAGQRAFGENYLQEAHEKIDALAGLGLEWHFIGPLQSNKTRAVAESFDMVHTIERLKIARRLSGQRPEHLPPLACCIQVNVSGEPSKSGVAPADVPALAREVAALPRLALRGLMALPAPEADPEAQRRPFARLRGLLEDLRGEGLSLDTLSMGMSADMEAAIAEGATVVRIGTALFGPRRYPHGG